MPNTMIKLKLNKQQAAIVFTSLQNTITGLKNTLNQLKPSKENDKILIDIYKTHLNEINNIKKQLGCGINTDL